jgi:hypothetical protein
MFLDSTITPSTKDTRTLAKLHQNSEIFPMLLRTKPISASIMPSDSAKDPKTPRYTSTHANWTPNTLRPKRFTQPLHSMHRKACQLEVHRKIQNNYPFYMYIRINQSNIIALTPVTYLESSETTVGLSRWIVSPWPSCPLCKHRLRFISLLTLTQTC